MKKYYSPFRTLCISNFFIFFIGLNFLSFISIVQAESIIYVHSSTGNDTTGDGSSETPYKTFHKAYTESGSGDTIDATGTFTWTDDDETGDASENGYTISKNLTIQGHNPEQSIFQAASSDNTADRRIFTISADTTVTIQNLAIRYGRISGSSKEGGGGAANRHIMTVNNCTIYNNIVNYMGGGLLNSYYVSAIGCVGNSESPTISETEANPDVDVEMSQIHSTVTVGVTIPKEFSEDPTTIQMKSLPASTALNAVSKPTNYSEVGEKVFDIKALRDPKTYISSFNTAVSITISYTDSDITGLDESTLWIHRYDDSPAQIFSFKKFSKIEIDINEDNTADLALHFPTKYKEKARLVLQSLVLKNKEKEEVGIISNIHTSAPIYQCPAYFARDLYRQMIGNDVQELQKYLNDQGHTLANSGNGSPGNETKYFGELTWNALVQFQKAQTDLTNNGIFDFLVRSFLGCVYTESLENIPFSRNFGYENKGEDVRNLQRFLNENGFTVKLYGAGSKGKETDYFGPSTKNALIRFQKSSHIPTTGYFDDITRDFVTRLIER